MIKFFDTCAMLELQQDIFKTRFAISNISLTELENIKTSNAKDEEVKWAARKLLHLLNKHEGEYDIIPYGSAEDEIISAYCLTYNNDSKIIATAYNYWDIKMRDAEDVEFITSDLSCYINTKTLNFPSVFLSNEQEDEYLGYKEVQMNDTELANFYNQVLANNENIYELLDNEYLIIKDIQNKIIDKYKWCNNKYNDVMYRKVESKTFGRISPKHNDLYQQLALDSLFSNQLTLLRGPAGSGKSYLAFGYMFNLLEEGKIDKIIIFCNTVATKGSAKLGFYPGSRTEKLLDSQIGNLLESKLGDRIAVERLIADGQLVLLPMSDIRGYDTTNMNAAIYISEAQNLDIELMKLALQRIGEDSICIIDGDDKTQVDMSMYAGRFNGMRRMSKVFRGQKFYGEVALQNIYRSKIAEVADKM